MGVNTGQIPDQRKKVSLWQIYNTGQALITQKNNLKTN